MRDTPVTAASSRHSSSALLARGGQHDFVCTAGVPPGSRQPIVCGGQNRTARANRPRAGDHEASWLLLTALREASGRGGSNPKEPSDSRAVVASGSLARNYLVAWSPAFALGGRKTSQGKKRKEGGPSALWSELHSSDCGLRPHVGPGETRGKRGRLSERRRRAELSKTRVRAGGG